MILNPIVPPAKRVDLCVVQNFVTDDTALFSSTGVKKFFFILVILLSEYNYTFMSENSFKYSSILNSSPAMLDN